ncbi:MAG: DUF3127 domain-containing protein [Flavobacteriaceae bacterium]|nr:DUF3127 domain-containing protein [Flavobacteriaceae bacterium]
MELEGKIKLIGETKSFGSSGFQKRELVLITEEQYPQFISVEFLQDKTDLLNNFNPGDQVKIGINLRGREWIDPKGEAKYFNSIVGWRIEKLVPQAAPGGEVPPPTFETGPDFSEEEPDDLPF